MLLRGKSPGAVEEEEEEEEEAMSSITWCLLEIWTLTRGSLPPLLRRGRTWGCGVSVGIVLFHDAAGGKQFYGLDTMVRSPSQIDPEGNILKASSLGRLIGCAL